MNTNKTQRYIDSLGSLIVGYNNSKQSSIGLPPNVSWNNKSNKPQISGKLQKYYYAFTMTKPRFKIGDIARIKLLTKTFL